MTMCHVCLVPLIHGVFNVFCAIDPPDSLMKPWDTSENCI